MPTATASDVEGVIDTSLSTNEIDNYLDDAEFEASQAIDDYATSQTTEEKRQLEKYLAAVLIRSTKEKGIQSQSGESRSVNYEGTMSVAQLQTRVDRRDPSGTLAYTVLRDGDRYVGSVGTE